LKIDYKKFLKLPYILTIVILIFVISFGTYRYFSVKSTKTYEGRVHGYIKEINSTNIKTKSLIKDHTIDVQASITLLPEIIKELKETKSFEILQAHENECLSNYEKAAYKKISIKLPKETEMFLLNAFAYVNEIIKLNRDSDIINSQKNDFISSMDNIVNKFKNINLDYDTPLKRVREEKKSYDGIVESIDKNIETLVTITESFNNISIPNNALEAHNNFKECLKGFNKYIQELRNAVTSESLKSKDKNLTEEEIDLLYENASENYEELKASFENFIKIYEKYKEK